MTKRTKSSMGDFCPRNEKATSPKRTKWPKLTAKLIVAAMCFIFSASPAVEINNLTISVSVTINNVSTGGAVN